MHFCILANGKDLMLSNAYSLVTLVLTIVQYPFCPGCPSVKLDIFPLLMLA